MNSNLFDLSGMTALVTGGSRGLGKAMAKAFAQHGADIVINSRKEEDLKPALQEILAGTDQRGIYVAADMAKREDVTRLTETALAEMGRVDILVNNAGINMPQPLVDIDDTNWDAIMEVNLSSCMALTRALAPQMKERGWGRVIYTSSIMGLSGREGRHAYCATKAGLIGLTRCAALELGPFGITVNAISPGPFLTEMPGTLLSEEDKRIFADHTALGRWGQPDELAGPALLLASQAGSYITGTNIVVDGGVLSRAF